jgi:hypothetical protein
MGRCNCRYVEFVIDVRQFVLLGQPKTHPLQDHLLMISAQEIPPAHGADTSTAIFLGGWDQHEGAPPQTPTFMSFLYPIVDAVPSGP